MYNQLFCLSLSPVPCIWDLTVWPPYSVHLQLPRLQIFRPCIYPSPGCNSGLPMCKVIRVVACPMTEQRFYCIMGRVENYFSSVSCPSCMGVAPLLSSAPWQTRSTILSDLFCGGLVGFLEKEYVWRCRLLQVLQGPSSPHSAVNSQSATNFVGVQFHIPGEVQDPGASP